MTRRLGAILIILLVVTALLPSIPVTAAGLDIKRQRHGPADRNPRCP